LMILIPKYCGKKGLECEGTCQGSRGQNKMNEYIKNV
jgi:hypothetical protein